MYEDIINHRLAVAENIAKSFGDELEKAHNVGDVHPNGKWVWTEYKPGKFDWRGKKADSSNSAPAASQSQQSNNAASTTSHSSQSQAQSKTSSEGRVTIGMSPGEEEDAYARAHKQNVRDYANAPQKLKARNAKMVSELERLGNKINNEIIAKIKEKSPHYGGSGDFKGISTGSLFFNHVPKEGEFEFNIHTRCYVEKDADNFVEKLHSSIQKVAKDNGFKFIKINRASGATGKYKDAKVTFKKELSDFNKKHEKNSWEEIK